MMQDLESKRARYKTNRDTLEQTRAAEYGVLFNQAAAQVEIWAVRLGEINLNPENPQRHFAWGLARSEFSPVYGLHIYFKPLTRYAGHGCSFSVSPGMPGRGQRLKSTPVARFYLNDEFGRVLEGQDINTPKEMATVFQKVEKYIVSVLNHYDPSGAAAQKFAAPGVAA